MPEEFKGEYISKTEYTKTTPRKWTDKELQWCLERKREGYTYKEIAKAIDRTETSVSLKLKRETKKDDTYNARHREGKYKANDEFIDLIKPKSVLDVYAGNSYYNRFSNIDLVTNDIDTKYDVDYNLDALKLMCLMYYKGQNFDIVDLDPFGSAFDCFDLAIKMAKKGIIITFGEMGHKRWKRLDFVSRHYNINSLEQFNTDNLIKTVQQIGVRNKKHLTPIIIKEFNLISRVYFTIEDIKITSQWE